MSGSYDDRDGKIWMNGKLVEWRDANVHILTHAMHYASSVFEGERAYGGKIFKSVLHSERLLKSAKMVDFEIPYSVEEIENAILKLKSENYNIVSIEQDYKSIPLENFSLDSAKKYAVIFGNEKK